MKKYEVLVTETLSRKVYIEAKDESEAYDKIESMHTDEQIVLDADDYTGDVNIEVFEEIRLKTNES